MSADLGINEFTSVCMSLCVCLPAVNHPGSFFANHIMLTIGLMFEFIGCTDFCITEGSSSLYAVSIIMHVIMHECE